MLLAVAQHRRLHSAFGWGDQFGPPCEIQACQNMYRQEEEPEEAGAGAAGEDVLLHANTIEDCELRSLLITFFKPHTIRPVSRFQKFLHIHLYLPA